MYFKFELFLVGSTPAKVFNILFLNKGKYKCIYVLVTKAVSHLLGLFVHNRFSKQKEMANTY